MAVDILRIVKLYMCTSVAQWGVGNIEEVIQVA